FNDTATTEIYTVGNTLSLHDALPISRTLVFLLQVGEPVRPSRLEPTVAPRFHVQVDLVDGRGIEQHVPGGHALRGPAVPGGVEEAVAREIGAGRAQGPAQIGRGRKDGVHRVLAVAAVAVDVPPLPPLVDRIRHQQAVPHGVPQRGYGGGGLPAARRPRHSDYGRDPGADQATPHEVLRP